MAKDIRVITIKRTGCYGDCPVYKAKIFADGSVVFKGEYWVEVVGERRFGISEKKLGELIAAFEAADYFSFKNLYRTNVTCGPSTITSWNRNGQRKRVVNEGPGPSVSNDLRTRSTGSRG